MFGTKSMFEAVLTWQRVGLAYGGMLGTANEVIWRRSLMMAQGTLPAHEAVAMVLEKPIAFAKSAEMALRAVGQEPAVAALAMVHPIGAKASANVRRLRRMD